MLAYLSKYMSLGLARPRDQFFQVKLAYSKQINAQTGHSGNLSLCYSSLQSSWKQPSILSQLPAWAHQNSSRALFRAGGIERRRQRGLNPGWITSLWAWWWNTLTSHLLSWVKETHLASLRGKKKGPTVRNVSICGSLSSIMPWEGIWIWR